MKKIAGLLLIGVWGMLALQVSAQPLQIGVKIGPNFSRLRFDPGFDRDGKLGFHMGVLTQIELADDFYLQPELLLSLQGNDRVSITNLNLPILVRYQVIKTFSLHIGLQAGILVGAEEDFEDMTKAIDFAIPFGAAYHPTRELGVGLRYVHGISNINDVASDPFKTYNQVVQVFLAYWIN